MRKKKIELPIIALRRITVFPNMIINFDVSRKKSVSALEKAMLGGREIFVVTQKDPEVEDPSFDDLYKIGTVAVIKQIAKLPDNMVRVLVEGRQRAELLDVEDRDDSKFGTVTPCAMVEIDPVMEEAMCRTIKELMVSYSMLNTKLNKEIIRLLQDSQNISYLIDQVIMQMPIRYEEKQKVLETLDIEKRYELAVDIICNEREVLRIRKDLQDKVKGRVDKNQKDYVLREQMKAIREELGDESGEDDIENYLAQVEKLKADKYVKDRIKKEISRFKTISNNSSESNVARTYIETLLEMPWNKASKDSLDIAKAEEILEADHYGLNKVKERVLEFLAVRAFCKQGDAPIICLVGPPGTGKTSIARSIAKALNREYVRICLGGVRDEAEIRGHRRTYVGALPGRIATAIKSAGVKNPLMLLDEIDKVSKDYKGDTASALLEVLDSEQNVKFRDHYIEIPLDLSEVMFIATANSAQDIPKPLFDRMEVIEVSGYTENEKFHIAKNHLVPKQLKKHGFTEGQLTISDKAIERIIHFYTKEAGVRELERKIGAVCRKAAKELLDGEKTNVKIAENRLEKYLGKEKYRSNMANDTDEIGIVRGLAWTSVGGDTLEIEVNVMPGKGELVLTGKLGDVMKESARAGITYIRSIAESYNVEQDFFSKNDIHIHIPEGAVPKDGPSAGITMACAMLSAIINKPVRADIAMTGEITLRGRVLPIGGLKEKLLAAKMAGIKTVLVPEKNRRDVEEISEEIKKGLEIVYVTDMSQVIDKAIILQ
ncbi:MAG: endopeptidase La [Lachnospiraceae bacterium]|nr:endopeptidase La [Lachnospiraceae bacterium]